MSKFLSFLLAVIMIFSFSACKNSNDAGGSGSDNVEQNSQPQISSDVFIETEPTGEETNTKPPSGANSETSEGSEVNNAQHSHVYTKAVTVATCETDGFTTYSCECGTKYTDDTVLAKGHQYSEWKEIKAATETSVGQEKRTCKNCKATESRDIPKIIKGHTHQYSSSITKAASCEEDGVKTFTCSCGASYTETIGKMAHNYSKTVVKPTCTTPGYTKNSCKCGKTYYDANVDATGHNYKNKVTAATCTNEGYTTYTCSTCNHSYTGNKTKALGHRYKDVVVAPTCTNSGYTTHTCSTCGHYYTDNKTSATGHKNTKTETVPATCFSDGSTNEVCIACKATVKTTTIPATGKHTYVAKTCAEAYKEVTSNNMQFFHPMIANYQHKTDLMCNVCSVCHTIKSGSDGDIWSMYSKEEDSKIMLNYVNELRKQYKASNPGHYNIINDKVELVYDAKLTELANIRAKEISSNFSHHGGTVTNAYECISRGGDTMSDAFNGWKNSSGHFDIMVHKAGVRFGYGRYIDSNGTVYNCLLIWSKYYDADSWDK